LFRAFSTFSAGYLSWLVKQSRAMVETNPSRNSQLETHPDDERGRFDLTVCAPSDGKISPYLGKLIFQAAAERHPRCSAVLVQDVTHRLVSEWIAAQIP